MEIRIDLLTNTQLVMYMNAKYHCSECSSSRIHADARGFYYCQNCGLTLELPEMDQSYGSLHKARNRRKIHQNAVVMDTGTKLGNQFERKLEKKYHHLQRLQNMMTLKPRTKAYAFFSQLKAYFDVGIALDSFAQVFDHFYPKIPRRTKCRNIQLLCATLFYYHCTEQHLHLNLSKCLERFGITTSDYFECLSVIKKINGKLQKKEGLQKLQKQILMYVSRGCTKLHLTDEIAKRARKIIAKYRPVLGQKPAIIAATALVLAINSCVVDPPLSVSHIASALDVSTSTVCSYYHSFRVRPNSIRYRTTQL